MSLADITWTDVVTAMLALYGAILSTIIGISRLRARRPHIKVKISKGPTSYHVMMSGEWSNFGIRIEAQNRGHKTIILAKVGIILPGGEKLALPFPPEHRRLTYELLPEHSCRAEKNAKELATESKGMGFAGQVKVIGFYEDQVGRTYKSKPFNFDVDEYV